MSRCSVVFFVSCFFTSSQTDRKWNHKMDPAKTPGWKNWGPAEVLTASIMVLCFIMCSILLVKSGSLQEAPGSSRSAGLESWLPGANSSHGLCKETPKYLDSTKVAKWNFYENSWKLPPW